MSRCKRRSDIKAWNSGGGAAVDYLAEHEASRVSSWLMNETGSPLLVLDSKGSNDLTVNGSPSFGNGPPNAIAGTTSARLISSGDFLSRAAGFGKEAGEDWTINLFVAMPAAIGNATIFSWGSSTTQAIALSLDSGNKLEYYERGTGGVFLNFDSQLPADIELSGAVHMITCSYESATKAIRTYLDSGLIGLGVGHATNPTLDASGKGFRFGNLNGSAQDWTGYIQKAQYWKGATGFLSDGAINQLWAEK